MNAPPKKPPQEPIARKIPSWMLWVGAIILMSPVWIPVLAVSGCVIGTVAWSLSLPELPPKLQGQHLPYWLERANHPNVAKRKEAVEVLVLMVSYLSYRGPMNCGGGFVWDEGLVHQGRIKKELDGNLQAVMQQIYRACAADEREVRIAALRSVCSSKRGKPFYDGPPWWGPEVANELRSRALAAFNEHPADPELRIAAAACVLMLDNGAFLREHTAEHMDVLLWSAIADSDNARDYVDPILWALPLNELEQARTEFEMLEMSLKIKNDPIQMQQLQSTKSVVEATVRKSSGEN